MPGRSIYIFYFLLIFVAHKSAAQTDTMQWSQDKKLQFRDFSIGQKTGGNYTDIMLHYAYNFQPGAFGRHLPIVTSEAIFNRKTSSLLDSTSLALRHAQLLFDMYGYESKRIKYLVMQLGELKGSSPNGAREKMDNIFFRANQEVAELRKNFEEDFRSKEPTEALLLWENKIAGLLKDTPDVSVENRTGTWQIGIFIGAGRGFFSGKTAKYFKDATGLNFGFEADIKKSRFALDLNLDFNKTKNVFEKEGSWPAGMKTHFANIELTYGFKMTRNRWLVVPYTGLSINEFTPAKTDKEDKRDLTGYSPVVGIEVNRNFKYLDDPAEKVCFFYKCKLSVNPSNLIKDYGGTQVNLRVAVGFDVSRVRKRLVYKK